MRLCIVTLSEEFSASAGVRIRYDRLTAAAKLSGHEIELKPLAEFQSRGDFNHDAYVFAKAHSPVAALLAWRMRQDGKLVGLDVFDDYFTQTTDIRLLRFRRWFAEMGEAAHFHLCSTQRLASAIAPLADGSPLEVINDPSEAIDTQFIGYLLGLKAARRKAGGTLRVLWFGIGDNPFFPVGLRDLAAYGGQLAALAAADMKAELRILTNMRALTPENLASLHRLPLPYSIEEWTPGRERDEMQAADVCFLPVNAQPFSQVKSLNRAVTALCAGCQVLSAGFPLYAELAPFVYRSAEALRDDLAAERPALRQSTIGGLSECLSTTANPYSNADRLFEFLGGLAPQQRDEGPEVDDTGWPHIPVFSPNLAVVHGAMPEPRVHKLAQRFNALTVQGPLCREEWNCRLRLDVTGQGRLRVLVESNITDMIAAEYRPLLAPFGRIKDLEFHELPLGATPLAGYARGWPPADLPGIIRMYAAAPRAERHAMELCRAIMPGVRFLLNERLAAVAPAGGRVP